LYLGDRISEEAKGERFIDRHGGTNAQINCEDGAEQGKTPWPLDDGKDFEIY
jgi:hypothetical protein